MDIYNELILIKDKRTQKFQDKTAEINYLKCEKNQVSVSYLNGNKTYSYNASNVRELREPKQLNVEQKIVLINGFPIQNPCLVIDFGEYVRIFDCNKNFKTYHKSIVSFKESCLNEDQPKAIFEYLKKLSSYVSVMDDGRKMLYEQYGKIKKISEESVLSTYLSGSKIKKSVNEDVFQFPFGFNLSQKKAVKTALENSISIIEGPPGTGKTQTILNIIANIVAKGQTVGVVSVNNSATSNVQEKLDKQGFGFITALLGNSSNKTDFFEHGQTELPNINEWNIETEEMKELYGQLGSISADLDGLLEKQNKIAKLKEELSKFELEQSYFENNYKDIYVPVRKFSIYQWWYKYKILDFILYYEKIVLASMDNKLIVKVYLFLRYGIYKFKFLNMNQDSVIISLKKDYYNICISNIKEQLDSLERNLENNSYDKLMEQYNETSKRLFKANLYNKYSEKAREHYTIKSFKYKFENFIKDYPVVLSTTYSIMASISENYLFDYIIIDEASQVDLVTASLALACCKNVVIVGDTKQLPQIVGNELEKKSNEIFYESKLDEAYNYSKYSIISSLITLYKDDLPRNLLCEHYRCHPKIIGFCNEKFYNNELVIMTEENENDTPLKIYKTAPGNHARKDSFDNEKGWYNLRQIEIIKDEIIGENKEKYKDYSDIGIICPYRKQVTETAKYLSMPEIEVDTVHKFQGREKNTIIFTTVVNNITPFVDNENLINVAVSRAVKELIVVTSNKVFRQHGTNLGDLIRYIEYNSLENDIVESQKVSVFDLLYSEYSDKLLKIMTSSKHVSEYKSENLMYSVIDEVLKLQKYTSFKCVIHIPLNSIVKDFTLLNAEEKSFALNPWAHVDFLIFNKLDKEPVLVVEVDGHAFHKNNEIQQKRDVLKDKILAKINLPIIRILTNESGERDKLVKVLDAVIEKSGEISL